MQDSGFYKELINVLESECKDTKYDTDFNAESSMSPLELFTSEDTKIWSKEETQMIEKIIALCGFSLEQTKIHNFTNTTQLTQAFKNSNTKYILLFCDTPIIKTINFSLNRIGFSTVANTKVYYNPKISDLIKDKEAKTRLWNAMKKEFKL